ncbi:MAG: hypothetical protein E5V67_01020 [Mesorhizobium sp.]|uniref:hypothetical protein n=1 Tax=Mesorhizobium sp. M00.F.Ca.ET.217.01.1.1 TaxID=2500529 RepID=UPI000FD7E61F|nr:hypothetical protein [Mesorhizobium sp. M00.F.Ca.ET.217.01.1.1]TGV84964.1 hypothetical protein EN801_029565 [Mesorhizobium sp. M00.F.Ca.ET.158.01.1.1]TIT86298.1 MAG: hypothetical protein E5W41_07260 [Mesorhizobium sp.]TGQ22684.1 hypothetical protein EN860_000505 [Mesorhizobium sp. M00.F.Ca.ET.217.01.1.1]TIT96240.1 MAG: hypothetical protein E5W43_22545 [Mesorhizobium sp.]TIU87088.1 MAG: hypothetical protein E5W06_07220 [Mesorhizobium sp.]
MSDFNANLAFLIAVVSAVAGLWWRIEASIKSARDEVKKDARDAHARADMAIGSVSLLAEQLAAHKLHVAETYITKAGLREFRDEVMTGVRDLKSSVSTLHERIDRFIEGDKIGRVRSSAD